MDNSTPSVSLLPSPGGAYLSINFDGSFYKLTAARQTMMSWARLIDSIQDIPEIYKISYQTLVETTGVVPYTVLAPSQSNPWNSKSIEQLLCEIGDTFYVLQLAGTQVITTGFSYHDICSLEVGNILLFSWFSIHGRTIAGTDGVVKVEFNEATLRHFEPFFSKMRPRSPHPDQGDLKTERAKFDYLIQENFKLMNFARQALVKGESVIQAVYQPGTRQSIMNMLGQKFFRPISLAHLVILTDQEVILLGDVEKVTEKKRSKYGGVNRFLPLRSIVSVELAKRPHDLLELTFNLSPGIRVKKLFDPALLQEVENLKNALETQLGISMF
jgi:hypothetical protein